MTGIVVRETRALGWLYRLMHRLCMAIPGWRVAFAGALVWGAAMAASAWFALFLDAWETTGIIRAIVILFAAGGLVAFPLGLYLARLLALGRNRETAFAAALLSFSVATIAATALLYALQYRGYYAQWHADTLSYNWVLQQVFTTLSSFYQFAVLGVRMYLPLGFAALILVSLWFVRQPR